MGVPELLASNPVFADYAFYAAMMALKVLWMGLMTSMKRGATGKFATPEDVDYFYKGKDPVAKRLEPDERVERVRKNHLNDLENIPVFWILGLMYVLIDPTPSVALWHFRFFAFSRLAHMAVYQLAIPQPSRALAHVVGVAVNVSMGFQIMKAFW